MDDEARKAVRQEVLQALDHQEREWVMLALNDYQDPRVLALRNEAKLNLIYNILGIQQGAVPR